MSKASESDGPRGAAASDASCAATSRHTYVCTVLSTGCTSYLLGFEYEFVVTDPPPANYVYPGPGPCTGTEFLLAERLGQRAQPGAPSAYLHQKSYQ